MCNLLTPAQLRCLRFFKERGVVKLFARGDPTFGVISKMVTAGFVIKHMPDRGAGLIGYELSPKGRAHLERIDNVRR